MYRQWGGDIINMSVIPEAKLAREAELEYAVSPCATDHSLTCCSSYALICTSTDFDAWRTGHAPVTVEEVVKTLHVNAGNARAVAAGLLQDVHDVVADGKVLDDIKGCMRFACITRKDVSISPFGSKVSSDHGTGTTGGGTEEAVIHPSLL